MGTQIHINRAKKWYKETQSLLSPTGIHDYPEDGGSVDLRNVGILPQHYTSSQPEDGGSVDHPNVGILPQHYTSSQPEDGGSVDHRNVGILPQHYTKSQPGRPRLETSSPWKPQNWHTIMSSLRTSEVGESVAPLNVRSWNLLKITEFLIGKFLIDPWIECFLGYLTTVLHWLCSGESDEKMVMNFECVRFWKEAVVCYKLLLCNPRGETE
jgi:hypothetical protein